MPTVINAKAQGQTDIVEVKFGEVTLFGAKPSAESVRESVERSSDALSRLFDALISPGVVLTKKRGIPYYSVDEHDPAVIVRSLDGVEERGRMVEGTFERF